jgi:hypothetical protein
MIDIPNTPKLVSEGHLSPDGAETLAKWKELFEKLGYAADIEEDNSGAVLLKNGDLLWFDSDAAPIEAGDYAPYIHGRLTSDLKGHIYIYNPDSRPEYSFKNWIRMVEEAGSPVRQEPTYGTWEEIYNIAAKYVEFRNSTIPPLPEELFSKTPTAELLSMHLSDKALGLSVRAVNALRYAGIITVKDLTGSSMSELFKMRNNGPRTLVEIDEFMKKNKISFACWC